MKKFRTAFSGCGFRCTQKCKCISRIREHIFNILNNICFFYIPVFQSFIAFQWTCLRFELLTWKYKSWLVTVSFLYHINFCSVCRDFYWKVWDLLRKNLLCYVAFPSSSEKVHNVLVLLYLQHSGSVSSVIPVFLTLIIYPQIVLCTKSILTFRFLINITVYLSGNIFY